MRAQVNAGPRRERTSVRYTPVDPHTFNWDRWLSSDGEEVYDLPPSSEPHRQVVIHTARYGKHVVHKTYTIITNDPHFGPYRPTHNTPEEAQS